MREASATLAAAFLTAGGFPVTRTGTTLITPGIHFEVLIACSGGKLLAASLALAAALAVLGRGHPARRAAALLAAAPLALAANALRVSGLVLAGAPTPPHLHAALGYAAFTLVAVALLALASPTPAQQAR